MIIVIACIIAIAVIAFVLGVRGKDLPQPEPESPFAHLDEKKAAIYDNLRDLQFEYRVGKLSEQDYQSTKRDLQKELASVLAEVDRLKGQIGVNGAVPPVAAVAQAARPAQPAAAAKEIGFVCPSCGSKFDQELKFCGECGKPMKAAKA
ncbi:MAG: hypothetical protein LAQ30_06710 [Acidobacteriia bacterium]|nr:hypothetical protein [Terriglobia bacterium]